MPKSSLKSLNEKLDLLIAAVSRLGPPEPPPADLDGADCFVWSAELSALIRRIAAELGCGVLLIEHNVGLVLGLCDHIVVLDSGAVIEEGPPAAIRESEKVRHAYMGTAADTDLPVLEVLE